MITCVTENMTENDQLRISYIQILSSWCCCLDDNLNELNELPDSVQNQIFEYFDSTVSISML